jgi:hypothetical protein
MSEEPELWPYVTFEIACPGMVSLGQRLEEPSISKPLVGASEFGDGMPVDIMEVALTLNTDESKAEAHDGVQLRLHRYHLDGNDGATYHMDLRALLAWEEARQLHAALGMMLAIREPISVRG